MESLSFCGCLENCSLGWHFGSIAPNINVYSPIFQWECWPFFQSFFNLGIWLVAVNPRKLISEIWISKKKIRRDIIRLIRQNYGKLIQVCKSIPIGWLFHPSRTKYQFGNLPYECETIAAMFPQANHFGDFNEQPTQISTSRVTRLNDSFIERNFRLKIFLIFFQYSRNSLLNCSLTMVWFPFWFWRRNSATLSSSSFKYDSGIFVTRLSVLIECKCSKEVQTGQPIRVCLVARQPIRTRPSFSSVSMIFCNPFVIKKQQILHFLS